MNYELRVMNIKVGARIILVWIMSKKMIFLLQTVTISLVVPATLNLYQHTKERQTLVLQYDSSNS